MQARFLPSPSANAVQSLNFASSFDSKLKKNNNWAAMVLPEIKPSLPQPERVVIPDGGNFVCGPDDICPTPASDNREFYKNDYCNLTSDSDVPGPIQVLCYNNLKLTTFYPRVMRVMTSTGNKFPTGYKFDV